MAKISVFAFTGRMFSGKDTIIEKTGLLRFGLADPIYDVAKYLYGDANKASPGVRKALQQLGRWGRGQSASEDSPAHCRDISRIIQRHGNTLFSNWTWVDWSNYGQPSFWLNILEARIKANATTACAISSVRWPNEVEWILNNGYAHVHVCCSEPTRLARMKKAAYKVSEQELNDVSEKLSADLDIVELPLKIWNDDAPAPNNHYLTPEKFLRILPHS